MRIISFALFPFALQLFICLSSWKSKIQELQQQQQHHQRSFNETAE